MKVATVALVVEGESIPALLDVISDDHEISLLESSSRAGEADLLKPVYEFRQRQYAEDDQFGAYVEDLLSQPFLRTEIQEHGVQWLKSKIRIEEFHKTEIEAAKTIAEYAMKVLMENPQKKDFFLAGPKSMVRVRVFAQKREKAA
jgi:hypothetical protein